MTFWVTMTEKGGKPQKRDFDQNEVTIGRVQGNDIVLPKGNISKRHSRIVLRDGKFIIVDLKSTNGTYVNGRRINSPQVLKGVDKIYIGDFTIQVEAEEKAATPEPEAEPEISVDELDAVAEALADDDDDEDLFDHDDDDLIPVIEDDLDDGLDNQILQPDEPEPEPEPAPAPAPRAKPKPKRKRKAAASNGAAAPDLDLSPAVVDARRLIYETVRRTLKDKGADARSKKVVEGAVGPAIDHLKAKSPPPGVNLDVWRREVVDEFCATGAIGHLLDDEGVVEIYINGPYRIWVRREGEHPRAEPAIFSTPDALAAVVTRMLGARFDADHPVAEGRTNTGTRVHAVHQSHAVGGPLVTVTRMAPQPATLADLAQDDVLSDGMVEFLETCVRTRRNVVVCGSPGASLGSLMCALGGQVPAHERIVVVEHVAELNIKKAHVVTLEAKMPSGMRQMVANALRMAPDRLLVHEMVGAEALEAIIAMGGGQEGTIVSTHAASAHDALARLTTMVCMGREEIPARVARQQIAGSVDVVVGLTRFADGQERVTEIVEVTGAEVDMFTTQEIFAFKRDAGGGGGGNFIAKGAPSFYQELKRRGENVNMAIFRDSM